MSWPANDVLKAELVSLGYTGTIDDGVVAYIRTRHSLTTGSYNDLLYFHLGAKGYTGALQDRIRQWDGVLFLAP